MECTFKRLIYPKDRATVKDGSYIVARYKPIQPLHAKSGEVLEDFVAVGYCLPLSNRFRYDLKGQWQKSKYGFQYAVETYEEVIAPTRESIIAYLSCGQVKGIGPSIAGKIYDAFGDETLRVLDTEPEKLLQIKGIRQKKLEKIIDSYVASRGARNVIGFLAPHGITANRAVRLYKEYGNRTMEIVQEHPYQLCELVGISFRTADTIAMQMGIDRMSPERVAEALLFTLRDAETRGHLCLSKQEFIQSCLKLLETPELTEDMVASLAYQMLCDGKLVCYGNMCYRAKVAQAEQDVASRLSVISTGKISHEYDPTEEIEKEEQLLRLRLDPEQKAAIGVALRLPLTVITGGPGTGKSTIQKAILDIYQRNNPKGRIICCAPTGRAARRLAECTGYPATTVHKALSLSAEDGGSLGSVSMLRADLILVDEMSMLDIYIARYLFNATPEGCQLVMVGDADQLPSVGPGAVLSEMIKSNQIAFVTLDKVHRQSAGSRIAMNARLIRHGNLSLEQGSDFHILQSQRFDLSAQLIEELYLQEIGKYGIDQVALLTPYRKKTDTGADALNERIRNKLNPPMPNKPEVSFGNTVFRLGDKVMQTKNTDEASNGDMGYITGIQSDDAETVITIDFGDSRVVQYDQSDLGMLTLGYASTIHKSQGGEWQSVIINLQAGHYVMLNRPLLYTAITRAKSCVHIVGERKAICMAINNQHADQRGTMLARRLSELDFY